MSVNTTSMRLDGGEHKRVTERAPARARPRLAARASRHRRDHQLIIALTLVIAAGFLLGLAVPIHP